MLNGMQSVLYVCGGNQRVAEASMKTEHYTINRLKKDYYFNSGQKQEVNSYVKTLKPIEDAN